MENGLEEMEPKAALPLLTSEARALKVSMAVHTLEIGGLGKIKTPEK